MVTAPLRGRRMAPCSTVLLLRLLLLLLLLLLRLLLGRTPLGPLKGSMLLRLFGLPVVAPPMRPMWRRSVRLCLPVPLLPPLLLLRLLSLALSFNGRRGLAVPPSFQRQFEPRWLQSSTLQ
jgi:hypothetical protein